MFGKKKESEVKNVEFYEAPLTIERILSAIRNHEVHEDRGCALVFAVTDAEGNIQMAGGGNPAHVVGIAINLIQQTKPEAKAIVKAEENNVAVDELGSAENEDEN